MKGVVGEVLDNHRQRGEDLDIQFSSSFASCIRVKLSSGKCVRGCQSVKLLPRVLPNKVDTFDCFA